MKTDWKLILGLAILALTSNAGGIDEAGWFNSVTDTAEAEFVDPEAQGEPSGSGARGENDIIAEVITPEIAALARGLEDDPKRIFDYVHDHIRYVHYFGSKKGAQLTLLERSGNDLDQCALLVALLRAAGYTNVSYQFATTIFPYQSDDHRDYKHWVGVTKSDSNWTNVANYITSFHRTRGFPYTKFIPGSTNTFFFHHAWVKLSEGGTNYFLDPSFKISEPVTGIDLTNAMQLSTNTLMTAAGGTSNSNFVEDVVYAGLSNALVTCVTNFVYYIQTNCPNASVLDVLGGQRIVSSADQPLSQALPFELWTNAATATFLEWPEGIPTSFMSKLTVYVNSASREFYMPELGGQRLSLTFSSSGLANLWLDDSAALTNQTTGGQWADVTISVDHPHGTSWNFGAQLPIDDGSHDQYVLQAYQRTNSTYAILYSFETEEEVLRRRQRQLDDYRQRGLADSSREITSETLNVMGLNWLLQTEYAQRMIAVQTETLPQFHHRLGRMAQEKGSGYYIDVPIQWSSLAPSSGNSNSDIKRAGDAFDVWSYFSSAFENGLIEQMQSSNVTAASTMHMLFMDNAYSIKVFLATTNNWTTGIQVRNQFATGPNTAGVIAALDDLITTKHYSVLIASNLSVYAEGNSGWAGYGYVAARGDSEGRDSKMIINGKYYGGYSSSPTVTINPPYIQQWGYVQPMSFSLQSFSLPSNFAADPVDMVDGSFRISTTDLTFGQREPRGISFSRCYSPTRRRHNLAGIAPGWIHNYYFDASENTAATAGMGATTPAQAASMIVATRAALELYPGPASPKSWLVTSLITTWGLARLNNNAVSVTLGDSTVQFVRLPDGNFMPPAGSTMTLLKTNSVYWLKERHGNTFKFDSKGRLTNIVDQYNQALNITYLSSTSSLPLTATDWKGRRLTFNYSGTPTRLTSITNNATGRSVVYGYATNAAGQLDLVSITDPEGKTSHYKYDATNHFIIAVSNAVGQLVTTNIFDDFGRVIEQYTEGNTNKRWRLFWSGYVNTEEDPAGNRRRYTYDDQHRLIAQEDALGNIRRNFYDGQDHLVMTVSPLNETNRAEYDARHNVVRTIDALGYTNQFGYDSQDRLTSSTDARQNTSRFGYNAQHSLVGSTNGAGDWTTFGYNSDGTRLGTTNVAGATIFGYDSYGQLSTVTYPANLGSETLQNNSLGDVTNRINARQFAVAFQYNQRRELTNTIAPTNVTAKIGYDADGNVVVATDARIFSTTNVWTPTRHLSAVLWPNGATLTNVYDGQDRLIQTINPLQKSTFLTNDGAGRLIAANDPLLRTMKFGYDANGRRIAATNALQETTRQQLNARGGVTNTVTPATTTIGRAYDPVGNQIFLTNRNGKTWKFYFDGANRLTNTVTPLNRETRVAYDSRGLVSTVREPSGQWTTNFHDARGRLTNQVDEVASKILRYDANNNLTNVVEQASSLSWAFDAYDRVSSYRDADGNLIQYRYDAGGNLTNLIYPGNRTVAYVYDSMNRLTNVTDWSGRKTSFEYDLVGKLTKVVRPNGTVREIRYDAAGQTTNIIERLTNNAPIAFWKLNWNNAARVDWEFTAPLPHPYTPPTRVMTYNDDNQLATFNGTNVIHDLDGNMTYGPQSDGAFGDYTFDARNRLGGTTSTSSQTSYAYDPAGNRTSVSNATGVTKFVINPNATLSEALMRIKNGVTNYYVHAPGVGLLYEITETATTTNTLTYHFDLRGSTVALTDGNGIPTDRVEYSTYGTTTHRTGTNDTPFLYNGRYGVQTDPNGLLYMRARYYNPHICRFINADPSGFNGGLNFFAYADGNPISMTDPFGLGAGGVGGHSWLSQTFNWVTQTVRNGVGGFLNAQVEDEWRQREYAANPQLYLQTHGGPDTSPDLLSMTLLTIRGGPITPGMRMPAAEPADTIAPGLRISPYRVTGEGETFIRYESANPAYTRITPSGGVTPGTFAAPASDGIIPVADRVPTYNLPSPQIPRPNVNILIPPAGTPIIGPRPVVGGLGNEVIFPMGY